MRKRVIWKFQRDANCKNDVNIMILFDLIDLATYWEYLPHDMQFE